MVHELAIDDSFSAIISVRYAGWPSLIRKIVSQGEELSARIRRIEEDAMPVSGEIFSQGELLSDRGILNDGLNTKEMEISLYSKI